MCSHVLVLFSEFAPATSFTCDTRDVLVKKGGVHVYSQWDREEGFYIAGGHPAHQLVGD
jgi:hypothetical protein